MKDKELLDHAARAIGGIYDSGFISSDGGIDFDQWEPLNDDGDALRLAVALNLEVGINPGTKNTRVFIKGKTLADSIAITQPHDDDKLAATRRAIVKAASEIGRAIK